jgi:acyl-CoA synthetase (AMP-forming)/AMP-acid ligase II
VVDAEFLHLLDGYRKTHPSVPILVDSDSLSASGEPEGEFQAAIKEGQEADRRSGGTGWEGLEAQCGNELDVIALAYTSGTTAKPKGVEYTHRGAYLAAVGNVVESGLGYHAGRCAYLWTLPQFHACGWTFPWAVTAVRGTHYCLRRIDYPEIWRLLKEEGITHFNAAPTVNTLLCAAKEAERLPQPVRVTVAASPPTAFLFEQMSGLNLHPVHVYGMTETYGPITKGYHMPEWEQIPTSEKYARMARQGHGFLTSLPVRIVQQDQPEGVLVDVARDGQEIGEIVFVGNICAKGYYKDPAATRKLFAGGVLHSGDLAVWHPDGAVQILDRAKDIIISGTFFLELRESGLTLLPRRREHLVGGAGEHAGHAPGHPRGRRGGRGRRAVGRAAQGLHHGQGGQAGAGRGGDRLGQEQQWHQPVHGAARGGGH